MGEARTFWTSALLRIAWPKGVGPRRLAVNMHFGLPFVMTDLVALGEDGPKEMLTKVADEQLIVFGAITDPQVDSYKGITGMGYTTVKAVKEGSGFRINGRKGFGTNSPIGDLFGSSAVYDDPEQGEIGLIFVLPIDTEGLVCLNDWDTLGMRASQSHSWNLENVFVEEDHVFKHNLWEWDKYARGLWAWHGGTFGSIYLGIAKAARDFAINQTRDRTPPALQAPGELLPRPPVPCRRNGHRPQRRLGLATENSPAANRHKQPRRRHHCRGRIHAVLLHEGSDGCGEQGDRHGGRLRFSPAAALGALLPRRAGRPNPPHQRLRCSRVDRETRLWTPARRGTALRVGKGPGDLRGADECRSLCFCISGFPEIVTSPLQLIAALVSATLIGTLKRTEVGMESQNGRLHDWQHHHH